MKKLLNILLSRLVLTGAIIALQAFILVFTIVRLSEFYVYIYAANVILSIVIVLYLVSTDNSPSLIIPWIIIIMALPVLGGFLYVLFGKNKMSEAEISEAKIISKKVIDARSENEIADDDVLEELKLKDMAAYRQARYIDEYANAPIYKNTKTQLLDSGENYYAKLLEILEEAEHYIFMEYFIVQEGKFFNSILEILEKKVKEGLDVRFMYDDLGSIRTLPSKYDQILEKKGIKCVKFNPFKPVLSIIHNNRDHRKICVVDGYKGITGGINLADEYINEVERFGHWKDSGIYLEGEAVFNLTNIFLESWNFYRNEDVDFFKYAPQIHQKKKVRSDGFVQPFDDSPRDQELVGESVYMNMINYAKKYIYINTPYLIVDHEIVFSLISAAKRGVDVRITTPHIPDKAYVHIMTQSYYERLISAGVKIFEYKPGFIHAKSFVCDDEVAVIGTINLDYRSLVHHFECGVWLYKSSAIKALYNDYIKTQKICIEVTIEACKSVPFYIRWKRRLLQLVAPLL
ncbi:MAG: cardiolipin synthase [Erysipelotrichaceae bacterium]